MRIFLDTNILIPAILSPKGVSAAAYRAAVTHPNHAFICEVNVQELRSVFIRKFPERLVFLEQFLVCALAVIDIVPLPEDPIAEELAVRDPTDRPILRAAIANDADILLTGDKDFLEMELVSIPVMTPRQFVETYLTSPRNQGGPKLEP